MADPRISPEAIHLPASWSEVLDVLFDDQRVFAISPERHRARKDGLRAVPWPDALLPYLRGTSEVTLRTHLERREVFREEVSFDAAPERVRIRDAAGYPLSLTKWGALQRPFDADSPESSLLLEDLRELLGVINDDLGRPAFVAYGTLLGAVRSGSFIGHDTDADIALYSRHEHPADIARESFLVQRELVRRGWRTKRMSGAFLQVWRDDDASVQRKIDIFTAYHVDDWFAVDRWVRARLPREAILPLSTVDLEGVTLPAPHDPEALLEVTYGPGWKVPDPTFKFTFPRSMRGRADGWFGYHRGDVGRWGKLPPTGGETGSGPSEFARFVGGRLSSRGTVVDLGCADGTDAVWFAQQGHGVWGLDYRLGALKQCRHHADSAGVDARFVAVSLLDPRSVVTLAARLRLSGAPTTLYAKNLVEGLRASARANLWLMADVALSGGGELYLSFRTSSSPDGEVQPVRKPWMYTFDPEEMSREIAAAGGTVLEHDVVRDTEGYSCRMVVTWAR